MFKIMDQNEFYKQGLVIEPYRVQCRDKGKAYYVDVDDSFPTESTNYKINVVFYELIENMIILTDEVNWYK
jgi:hypothetical protein